MLLVVHHVSEIWVTTSFTNFYNDHISKFEATGSWDLNLHKIYWQQFIGTDITDSIGDTFPYIAKLSKCRQKSQNLEVSTALLCWRQIFRRYFFPVLISFRELYVLLPLLAPLYIVKFSNPRRITEGRTTHVEMSTWARCLLKGSPDQLKNLNVSLHLNIHFFRT